MHINIVASNFTKLKIVDSVLIVEYLPGTIITEEIAKACVLERKTFCNNVSTPVVFVLSEFNSSDKNARKYLSTDEAMEGITVGAFVVSNHLYRAIGSVFIGVYLKFNKNCPPVRIFNDFNSALNWAKKYTKE